MVIRTMKTTLMIPDELYGAIKLRAAQHHRTISDMVADLLQAGLRPAPRGAAATLPKLPSFDMGRARVDVADRDALERAMRS